MLSRVKKLAPGTPEPVYQSVSDTSEIAQNLEFHYYYQINIVHQCNGETTFLRTDMDTNPHCKLTKILAVCL